MLAGKTTPNQATMLHSEFPITPTWRQLSGHRYLDWFRPQESKTIHPVCGGIMRELGRSLEWSSRPPYMVNGPGLPFEVGRPSSVSVTS
jgi:hypothetical protein